MLKRFWVVFAAILVFAADATLAGAPVGDQSRDPVRPLARVLLIPLDDRPPCLQFTQLVGNVGDVEVVAPPREMLGRFTDPGRPDQIAQWVRSQQLESFDAAIVSIDMLAYGGLVNSRVHRTPLADALDGVSIVRQIKERAPRLPIYGFSVIMRLAPTGDGRNEAYREKLARWAEISPYAADDAALREEVKGFEAVIPAAALVDYKEARRRNLEVNRASLKLVQTRVLDYLILSQDDAKPRGVHVTDRERLITEARAARVGDRVAVQPGADEVAMLLLARAVNKRFGYAPRVNAIYSSDAVRKGIAPYEDRPLNKTVSFHIAATGSRESARKQDADILFFVYGSRFENGVAERFADEIASAVRAGRRVIVADIDVKGDVQGADPGFTEALLERKVMPQLMGYASWNTAGNTIGTALPHGIVFARVSQSKGRYPIKRRERIASAQTKFLLHRLIDDYAYHALVRPNAIKFARERGFNPSRLTDEGAASVEKFINEEMRAPVRNLWVTFDGKPVPDSDAVDRTAWTSQPAWFSSFRLFLPWGRTFEAEIDFKVDNGKGTAGDNE
jgi:hypothetical protein